MSRLQAGRNLVERFLQNSLTGISWLTSHLFGRLNWQPPAWTLWVASELARGSRYLAADRRRALGALAALLAIAGGLVWYKTQTGPALCRVHRLPLPVLTEYNDKGISSIKPLTVDFNESAAPLQQVEKAVTSRHRALS